MFTVYILRDKNGKFYKGLTNDLPRRLQEHHRGKTKSTSRMENLEVIYTETFNTFDDARKRELYFKSGAGRRYLKKKLSIGPLA
ncbi:MAG: hypothetical protein A2122_02620 [Candidatus Liptonbacteria bacterium GWB1_49_6]|uniref:GIY-YIG domain-containing protein n=1 Tax=Candidatus Liptonbacteria bacterium GWB1_49_6 TaxID=1798644 RepID=A0A1G2C5C2_9BACT|nr:MAG: hypothetical protein A2122_02620 [Candidatus Liptonbacteria bacterium GWB1_49_6]